MPTSAVVIFIVVGFAAGLTTGVFAAYHVLVAVSRIDTAISDVARKARPF